MLHNIEHLFCRQLNRDMELHLILPNDYDSNKNCNYPVLYFYDGDRIFETPDVKEPSALSSSFEYGSYSVVFDRTLPKIIMVGIAPPHNMWARTAEYSPYEKHFDVPEGVNFEPHVHGKGKELGDWVVHTLKPWIDCRYRTLPDKYHTGIGGLSTSGVNAIYMISTYPKIFSRFLIHAPASHLWMDKLSETLSGVDFSHIQRGYFDIGTDDCTRMVKKGDAYKDLKQIMKRMVSQGLDSEKLRFVEIYRGTHECATWKYTFPDALRWVYHDAIKL